MSGFKSSQGTNAATKSTSSSGLSSSINNAVESVRETRVIKLDGEASGMHVSSYSTKSLNSGRSQREVSQVYTVCKPDGKFQMNAIVRESVGINGEEQRLIQDVVDARVQEQVEKLREETIREAKADGFEQGRKDAEAKYAEEASVKLDQLETLISELEGHREKIFHAQEQSLVEMIFRIAKMLTLRDLKEDRGYVLKLATKLLDETGARENISIRLNKMDFEMVDDLRQGLIQKLGQLKNLQITCDDEVGSGGCIIETDWNAMDATLESQLEQIYQGLRD